MLTKIWIECDVPDWVGDGFCDDQLNTIDCNFDEGDCCVPNVNTKYCTDCVCLGGNGATTKMNGNYYMVIIIYNVDSISNINVEILNF